MINGEWLLINGFGGYFHGEWLLLFGGYECFFFMVNWPIFMVSG